MMGTWWKRCDRQTDGQTDGQTDWTSHIAAWSQLKTKTGLCSHLIILPPYTVLQSHGGTTGEGNCSYLLPRAAAAGSNGTNKGQIHKVPFDEIARFLVYRMDVTESQSSANTGIIVCLVREIWRFRVFTGKEVTPLHEEGNSLQFCAGKKATHFHSYKWFIDIWQTDKTERKERSPCEIVNWKYVSRIGRNDTRNIFSDLGEIVSCSSN